MPSPVITLAWLTFIAVGAIIGHSKGRTTMGVVWSLILGPIGVLIVALLPKTEDRQVEEARQRARVEERARHAS